MKRIHLLIPVAIGLAVLGGLALRGRGGAAPELRRPAGTPPRQPSGPEPQAGPPPTPRHPPRPGPRTDRPVAIGRLLDRKWPGEAVAREMAEIGKRAGKLQVPPDQRSNVERMIQAHLRTLTTLERHPPQVRTDLLQRSRRNLLGGLRMLGGEAGRRPPEER